jgi:orotidine-5'-phosphate decarboxylase
MSLLKPATPRDRLMLALDVATVDAARRMIERTHDTIGVYKIGYRLAYQPGGLDLARELSDAGVPVFLDLKLLDIDNTVTQGVESIARLGVAFLTLHAYPKAIRAAIEGKGAAKLTLLGVTVLTSMDDADLAAAGYRMTAEDLVIARAKDAAAAGLDGLVSSAAEVAAIRAAVGPDMILVTPGIRPSGADAGDQKRVVTPADAIRAGADYLVVGRPILAAADPRGAALAIVDEIGAST